DRLLMRTVLTSSGFTVSEADDGSTALPFICEGEDIDAILLDLRMKEMDGLETLRAIRESEENGALPVVILTGSQEPDEERQLLEAGADDYLRKPVDPLQLIARVRAVLRRARL
ncbi:MAG: response regulator, partial [Thermoplasmata archaeon]